MYLWGVSAAYGAVRGLMDKKALSKTRKITHWDQRFLGLARYIAKWSKDPSTRVGAVIVDCNKRIVSTGFNGLPSGVEDTLDRLQNRDLKYQMIVHAERNAIIDARRSLGGHIIYVWPMMPCAVCAAMIIQAGICEVVAPHSDNPRWADSFQLTREMFTEAGVSLTMMETLPAED